jgi:hypothetical protein
VIGVDVDGWSWDALVASPVRSAVVWCILPVCRVRVAYTILRCEHNALASYLGFGTLQFSGSLRVNDPLLGALCPSKSGLMNKHIVKHIVKLIYK